MTSASLSYIVPAPGKPQSYMYEPPPGVPEISASYEPRVVAIQNMRPDARTLSLDAQGFRLLNHVSGVQDFYDDDEVRRTYYPEVQRLVAETTGASRVEIFDHTVRRREWNGSGRSTPQTRMPVPRVHNDYTAKSGPQRVRDLMGNDAEDLLQRRFSVINVWRPIRGPLEDAPLALLDATSMAADDLVATDLLYKDRVGEIYYVRHNPSHRWFYAPRMSRDEVLLFRCYDSLADGRARFVPHAAFEDPTMPQSALPRESIELRTLAFY
jgi:hypothetical protein